MVRRFTSDVKRFFAYIIYAAKSELKSEVAGSYLNWIWWILEPLCLMLIYAFVFGVAFGSKEDYFPAFVFIGLTIWTFFNVNLQGSVTIIKRYKGIIEKVYMPKFILLLSNIAINGFKMLISFGLFILLMIVYQVHLTWSFLFAFLSFADLLLVTFGCMTILMHFGVFIEDLSKITSIVLRFVFYLTGVFYDIHLRFQSKIPGKLLFVLEKCNPVAVILTSLRDCLLYGKVPHYKLLIFWFIIGLLISIVGVRLVYKNENNYLKVV